MHQHSTPQSSDDNQVSEAAWDYLYLEVVSMEQRLFRTDADIETSYSKLELLGFRVGYGMAERQAHTICSRYLGAMHVYAGHWPGVFVLVDNNFRWLSRMASDTLTGDAAKSIISDHLALPCGIIRGTLASLGVSAVVVAETPSLPQCTFQIKLSKK
ncbi:hypothetical protein BSLG_008376 [Batrachochytrium salamandrivorans]|nr:hypothetical protein BSLG_008376 [Batrachochytrium salamandrivorans]